MPHFYFLPIAEVIRVWRADWWPTGPFEELTPEQWLTFMEWCIRFSLIFERAGVA